MSFGISQYEIDGQTFDLDGIREWCRNEGRQMARVKHTWREAQGPRFVTRSEVVEMPAQWLAAMRYGGMREDAYQEIERYDP